MRSDGPKPGQPAETRIDVQHSEPRDASRGSRPLGGDASRAGEIPAVEGALRVAGPTPRNGRSFFRPRTIGNPLRLTGWRRYAGVLAPLALACSAVFAAPAATAAPAPTVDSVKKQVEKLREEADQAAEDYAETREKRKSSLVKLKAAKKDYAKQKDRVATLKEQVGLLAAESYKKGELSTLDLFLSDDPESALAQSGYLPSLSDRQAGALNSLTDAQQDLLDTQKTMQEQADEAKAAQTKMKKSKEKAEKKLASAEAQLDQLEASQRAAADVAANSGGTVSDNAGGDCSAGAAAAPSAAAKAAINFACSQLGDPYVWAAAGPNSWDCSGLTMAAYASGGVSLPHSSRLQASYGTSVSISALQPGDLVFFHSPISHVGIYLGSGMMVHAPSTGDVVKVASMWTTPSAAVRLG
ncbi:C40 family peptidase [Kineosporia sp. J2-2]|uniref:C40 family peptidase n=1 Tax=Kineosporia corallincola TaxID=2835133 RepID=A0ABS5TJL1_9ACTN|nr:C40 family peptidase [Kineosporia corallincola]MBT0771023.1 C40 family peptidase [Kineosporia corallincola]